MGALYRFSSLGQLVKSLDLTTFIETGTGLGDSLKFALQHDFKHLYSIEIDKELLDRLQIKDPRLNLINADSFTGLQEVLKFCKGNCFFFLDAHFPGADFGKMSYPDSIRQYKERAFPLIKELEIITSNRDISKDVILIDDFILYDITGDYETNHQGVTWNYEDVRKEQNLCNSESDVVKFFNNTHSLYKIMKDQGYLLALPK